MMDSLQQSAQTSPPDQSATANPRSDSPDALPPQAQAVLDKKIRDLESGFHAKVREVNNLVSNLQQQQQQLLTVAQQRQLDSFAANPTPEKARLLTDTLPPEILESMDSRGKHLLNTLGATIEESTRPVREENNQLKESLARLEAKLTQREQRDENSRIRQEAQAVAAKYGEDVIRNNSESITKVLAAIPGIPVESAVQLAAPGVIEQHLRRQIEGEYRQKSEAATGAGLEGMFPMPSAEPSPSYTPGESMMESAMGANDPGMIRSEALRASMKGL